MVRKWSITKWRETEWIQGDVTKSQWVHNMYMYIFRVWSQYTLPPNFLNLRKDNCKPETRSTYEILQLVVIGSNGRLNWLNNFIFVGHFCCLLWFDGIVWRTSRVNTITTIKPSCQFTKLPWAYNWNRNIYIYIYVYLYVYICWLYHKTNKKKHVRSQFVDTHRS